MEEETKRERKLYVMFCKNCGKELPDGAKFCGGCGTPVTPSAQESASLSDTIVFPGAGFPGDEVPVSEAPVFDTFTPEEDVSAPEESASAPEEDVFAPEGGVPAGETEPLAPEESAPQAEGPQEPAPGLPVSAPVSTPVSSPIPAYVPPAEDPGVGQGPVKRRGKAGLVVLGGGAVVLILVVVLLVKLISGLAGGGKKAVYAYLNDDGELMYLADLKEKTEALELTDEADYSSDVRFSPDGKTVYFTDSESTLYRITVAELKKGSKPERISRSVGSFSVLKDGKVAYTQYDSGENRLSIYEKGDSYRLARGYYYYRISEDQKSIYYTERDESDNTVALYKMTISKDAKEERLLKGAHYIYSDFEDSVLVYGVDDRLMGGSSPSSSSSSQNTITVYSCTPGGDKTKLVSDVSAVSDVTVDGSKVSFYYFVADAEERTLYDFVTDSKASEDARTLSGDRPRNPSWYDYAPADYNVVNDTTVEYADGNGNWHSLNVSSLLTVDNPTAYEVYMNTWTVEEMAREDAQRRYDADRADYDARIGAWNEAQNRDSLREDLKNTPYNQNSLSLYHYTGSDKSDPIATGIKVGGWTGSGSDGVFLYHKVDLESGKVANIEDLNYPSDLFQKLQSGGDDEDWYQNVGGKESVIDDLEDITNIYEVYVLNGKEVVLDVYDGYDNSLLAFSLGKESLTLTSTIIDDDFSGPYPGKSSGKDVLYLFTDVGNERNGTVGDFCIYKDGKLETIAKEIYGVIVLDESGTTYAVTDVDSRGNGELSLMKNGTATAISDEINGGEPVFLDGTQFLYLSDGDLMLWNGKESRRIARDVEYVWASTQESYSSYSPYY